MPNKQKREAEGTILAPTDLGRLKDFDVQNVWEPNPAQLAVLQRTEFEVFCGAGKYSGKTEMSRIWMVRGNLDRPNYDSNGKPILHNISYVYHPHFLGAVIRLNEKDLAEWVDRAKPYYEGVLGGTFTKNPAEFRWPSGARIFLGHAQDSNAWTKYQGQNIVRFLIEESGQIPDLDTFDMIRSCCRSLYPEMLAQILLTANPGGKGQQWQFDRYIEPRDRKGNPIMHPDFNRPIVDTDKGALPITEEVENPFTGKILKTSRIWMPLYMTDNPHAMKDTNYIAVLATMQNEKMKRAYLYGDWKAFRGSYFDNFRKETHTFDPKLRHVAGWWRATASLDWGFQHESAAYWHKQDPETKQHLLYKEFCTSHTDPVELGAELARRSQPELRSQGAIVFYVSHDLFNDRIGDFTWAELLMKGAQKVIGAGTCLVPDILITKLKEQYRIDGKQWDESLEDRILSQPVEGIVFRRAPRSRAVGFMHMRTLMRVEPLFKGDPDRIDWKMAMTILEEGTAEDYSGYLRSFNREVEILPEMLISIDCPRLIDAIPKCQHSEKDPEDVDDLHFFGMDSIDSCRYLLAGIRDEKPSPMPKRLNEQRIVEEAMRRNPSLDTRDLIWMMRAHEEREEDGADEGFVLRRGGRGRIQ